MFGQSVLVFQSVHFVYAIDSTTVCSLVTNKTLTLKQNKQTNKNTHVFAFVVLSRKGRIIRFH